MISKPFSLRLAGWFFMVFILGAFTLSRIVALLSPKRALFVPSHMMFIAGVICGLWWLVGTLLYRWRVKRMTSHGKNPVG
jgi:hypothetical protein